MLAFVCFPTAPIKEGSLQFSGAPVLLCVLHASFLRILEFEFGRLPHPFLRVARRPSGGFLQNPSAEPVHARHLVPTPNQTGWKPCSRTILGIVREHGLLPAGIG